MFWESFPNCLGLLGTNSACPWQMVCWADGVANPGW